MVSSTLFVKNLDSETTVEALKEVFKKYGKVNDVAIDDECTNATVVFARVKAAEKALNAMNGKDVCGSVVKITMEDEESEDESIDDDVEDVVHEEEQMDNDESSNEDEDEQENQKNEEFVELEAAKPPRICRTCSQEGHIAKFCPENSNSAKKFEKLTCFKCGKFGHKSHDCKMGGRSGGSRNRCFNCSEEGHMSRECPNKSSGGRDSNTRTCFNCKQAGHISRDCPTKSESNYDSSNRACYKCGESGHMIRDCPKKSEGGNSNSRTCYKCGDPNHISRDCSSSGGPIKSRGNSNFKHSRKSPYSKNE